MTRQEEKEILNDIKNLFPTEQIYRDFLIHRKLNGEEREIFVAKNKEWFSSLSPEERKQCLKDISTGIWRATEYFNPTCHFSLKKRLQKLKIKYDKNCISLIYSIL
jgi:hypothetical protein